MSGRVTKPSYHGIPGGVENEQYKQDMERWKAYESWVHSNYGPPPPRRHDDGGGFLARRDFYRDPTKQLLYAGQHQQAAEPEGDESPGGGSGGSGSAGVPDFDQAKAEWEAFKSDFAAKVQSVTESMAAKGDGAWGDARRYVSSGLRTPEREAAYGQARPDVAAGWDDSRLEHYRQHGRAEGTPYVNPEQPRGYGL